MNGAWTRWQGGVLVVLAAAFFAVNVIAARVAVGHGPPVLMGLVRCAIASAVIVALTGPTLFRHRAELRRDWRAYLVLGTLGTAFNAVPIYLGAPMTTATNIGLISTSGPVLIVLGSHFFLRDRATPVQLFGTALALIGVVTIVLRGDIEALAALRVSWGDLLTFVAMACWSVYAVGLRFYPSRIPALPRLGAMTVCGFISLVPCALLEWLLRSEYSVDATFFGAAAAAALLTGVAGFAAHGQATLLLGANRAALASYLVPVFSVIAAVLLLDESLYPYHAVGGALTVLGVWIASRPKAPAEAAA